MQKALLILFMAGLCGALLGPPGIVDAITIQFTATDLNDVPVPAGDLWQYSYVVSGFDFPMYYDFQVLFSPDLYSDLENPPPFVNADWDVLTLQPDPSLYADGLYDAFALVDNASLANLFTVSFVWFGGNGTTSGAQPFVIKQFGLDHRVGHFRPLRIMV